MYSPKEFVEHDAATLHDFMRAYPFATVVSVGEAGPVISHLPLLLAERVDALVLRGHIARVNPHFAELAAGHAVTAILHGPHGYISPRAYEHPSPTVPTWNYAVVHAHGAPTLLDDAGLFALLEESVELFEGTIDDAESAPWTMDLPNDYRVKMMAQICGFEIRVTNLEGKLKLSQNRTETDRRGVVALLGRGDAGARELAALMKKVNEIE